MSLQWGKATSRSGFRFGEKESTGVAAGNYVLYIDAQGNPVRETAVRKQVDQSWRAFWRGRGFADAPQVSRELLGVFDLPKWRAV